MSDNKNGTNKHYYEKKNDNNLSQQLDKSYIINLLFTNLLINRLTRLIVKKALNLGLPIKDPGAKKY